MAGLGWNFVPASQVSVPLQSGGHGIVGDEQEFVFLLGKRAFQPQKSCIFLLEHGRNSSGQSMPRFESIALLSASAVINFFHANSDPTWPC